MVALGAKIVEKSGVQRTAKEAGMDEASENSVLSNVAKNVSSAYERALYWAWQFMDRAAVQGSEDLKFELNTDYEISALDPQLLSSIISAWQSGALLDGEMRRKLEKANLAFEDIEEWKDGFESNPAGLPETIETGGEI